MPQFVILRHTFPPGNERADHFDVMLEDGDTLLTWAIAAMPSATKQLAAELSPHRRAYLTYEGPVLNNRGEVQRVAAGNFTWLVREAEKLLAKIESPQLSGLLHWEQGENNGWSLWLE